MNFRIKSQRIQEEKIDRQNNHILNNDPYKVILIQNKATSIKMSEYQTTHQM